MNHNSNMEKQTMGFKSVQITINNVTVTLAQTKNSNAHGTVYVLSSSLGGASWGYGRGDTQCIEILEGSVSLKSLAEQFIAGNPMTLISAQIQNEYDNLHDQYLNLRKSLGTKLPLDTSSSKELDLIYDKIKTIKDKYPSIRCK
jgi:actin-related protein